MNINDWSNKEIIKFLTSRKRITQKELVKMLKKTLLEGTFSGKLAREALKVSELQNICDVLGFEIILQEKNNIVIILSMQ